jgi:hypothetical protein
MSVTSRRLFTLECTHGRYTDGRFFNGRFINRHFMKRLSFPDMGSRQSEESYPFGPKFLFFYYLSGFAQLEEKQGRGPVLSILYHIDRFLSSSFVPSGGTVSPGSSSASCSAAFDIKNIRPSRRFGRALFLIG